MKSDAPTARRTIVRQYKEQGPAMGVYRIHNTVTARTVLHASRNVQGAMNRDRFELRLGSHRDAALQHDWNAHGEATMQFEIVEIIVPKAEPTFDAAEALATSLALWRDESAAEPLQGGRSASDRAPRDDGLGASAAMPAAAMADIVEPVP